MAGEVETFRGPVASSALGTTLIHEHVFVGHPELDLDLPHPEWCEDVAAPLSRRTDPVTARALVALMDGICLQVLLTDTPYDEAYAREVLGRLLPRNGRPCGAGCAGASGCAG